MAPTKSLKFCVDCSLKCYGTSKYREEVVCSLCYAVRQKKNREVEEDKRTRCTICDVSCRGSGSSQIREKMGLICNKCYQRVLKEGRKTVKSKLEEKRKREIKPCERCQKMCRGSSKIDDHICHTCIYEDEHKGSAGRPRKGCESPEREMEEKLGMMALKEEIEEGDAEEIRHKIEPTQRRRRKMFSQDHPVITLNREYVEIQND